MLTIQQEADRARNRYDAFTAGPVSAMLRRNALLLQSSPLYAPSLQSLGEDTVRPITPTSGEERKVGSSVATWEWQSVFVLVDTLCIVWWACVWLVFEEDVSVSSDAEPSYEGIVAAEDREPAPTARLA